MHGIRLNIRTPWRFIIIALTPGARTVSNDGRTHWVKVLTV